MGQETKKEIQKNPNHQHGAGATAKDTDGTVEVLYQKMGDRWFAFSLVDDEVFVGSISQEEIDVMNRGSGAQKV